MLPRINSNFNSNSVANKLVMHTILSENGGENTLKAKFEIPKIVRETFFIKYFEKNNVLNGILFVY